jgi:zinc protease
MRAYRNLSVAVTLVAVMVACGPKSTTPVTPTLPGDGTDNTAKPIDTGGKPAADPWAGRKDLIKAPAVKPPSPLDLPPIERFTLKNGLKVFVIKSDRLPVASFQLAIRTGRSDEPRNKVGVASFTAGMLTKGAKKKSALDVAKAIDHVGGALGANATYEATLVSCSVLAKDLGTCSSLVADMMVQPTFAKDEMAKVREQLLGEVRNRLDQADQLAGIHFQNLLWGDDHVRGWASSEPSIAAISREDLIAWHKAWYSPSNAMLAIAGDVDAAKLKVSLEKAFGAWKKTKTAKRASYPEPKLDRVKVRLVDKPKQTQTHIRIGHFGIKHTDPRFFDTLVWNYVLGGGNFSSRLMKVVRSDAAKTYGASSTFDRNLDKGSFAIGTFTRTAETVSTVKLILGELEKMAKNGPTEVEVADAISNIAGSYAVRYEGADDLASAVLAAELHGFGEEYLENYAVHVGKVDAAAARRAAREILDPVHFVIVLVGDAKAIEPQLDKAGWRYEKVRFTDPVGVPQIDLPKADPAQEKAARKFLDEALAAKGKKMATLKTLKMSAKGRLVAQKKAIPVTIERTYMAPDKMRVDLVVDIPDVGQQAISYALDGDSGWQLYPDGAIEEIPAADVAVLVQQRWHDPEFILTRHLDKGTIVNPLPDETADGKTYAVINLVSADGNSTATLYLERKTKRLVQLAYPESGRVTVDVFDDFKKVDGIEIAHRRMSQSGDETAELTIEKVEIDPKVDAAIFAKPKK